MAVGRPGGERARPGDPGGRGRRRAEKTVSRLAGRAGETLTHAAPQAPVTGAGRRRSSSMAFPAPGDRSHSASRTERTDRKRSGSGADCGCRQDMCAGSCRRQRHPLRPDLVRRPHRGRRRHLPLGLHLPLTSRSCAGFGPARTSGVARAGRKREGRAGRSRSRCHSQTTLWRRGRWPGRRGSRCRPPARRRVRPSRTGRRSGELLDCRR